MGICDLLRFPTLRINALLAGMFYFIAEFNYYGSIFGIEALKGDIYFNSIFSAFSDLIGNLLIEPILKRCRRKSVYFITFFIVTIAGIFFIFI